MAGELARAFPAAKAVFDRADAALGEKLSTLMLEGPEAELTLTANAQPAIVTASIAALEAIRAEWGDKLALPAFTAGHSLGEYSALVAAGALAFEDAIRICRARGRAMQEAVPAGRGAMAAIMGVEAEPLEALCKEVAAETNGVVTCANFNAPGQIVVAGTAASVARLQERVGEIKGKAIPLKVSAPFHCSLMAPAAKVVASELGKVDVKPLAFPVVANVDAKPNSEPGRVKELLVRQVDGAVRWEQGQRFMAESGVTHAIEIGPGKVLAGLGKRISKDVKMVSIGDEAGVKGLGAFWASAEERRHV